MEPAPDRPLMDRVGRALFYPYFRVMHGLRCYGLHNVPCTGPGILAANHQSFFDPILIELAVNRRVAYLAWKYYYDWPVLGALMRLYGAVPVDLDRPGPASILAALRALRQGRLCGIFPEAGRTADGFIGNPMLGAAVLALRSRAPLIPVTIMGAYRAWPRGHAFPTPAPISLYFSSPVPIDQIRRSHAGAEQELRAKATLELMLRIADGFAELGRPDLARRSRDRLLAFFKR